MRAASDQFSTMNISKHLSYLNQLETSESSVELMLGQHAGLAPFLRSLLVADGTVTLAISAFFDESIDVVVKEQAGLRSPLEVPTLGLNVGDNAFYRCVDLVGAETERCYASAVSVLNPTRIHDQLFDELIDEQVGMGEVLRNSARGSYREVLDIRRTMEDEMSRTYAVFVEGYPAILITEGFNEEVFY